MNRALLGAMLAAATLATLPTPALADARLVQRMYDPGMVTRIDGQVRVQATIRFADTETIENVAIGDSQAWQVTPNKRANLLFVKPLSPNAATNMTVVTDKRTYYFDLVAGRGRPVYEFAFLYPPEPEAPAPLLASASPEELAAAEAAAAPPPPDPASLNFAWGARGDARLLPVRTYDDGQSTFLSWPAEREVPAILITDAEGTEGPVNFSVRGETIVVDGVPGEIVLRSGRDSARLVRQIMRASGELARNDRELR